MTASDAEDRDSARAGEDTGRQVIARAACILRALETAPSGLTIAGLTRASALPRTTVNRLVTALAGEHLLVVVDGRVRLGPALVRLAAAAAQDVVAVVRPHAEALAREVRETVDLWVERETVAELVDEVISDQEVRVVVAPGARLSLATTAPGKAFLARLDDAGIAARLARAAEESPEAGRPPHPRFAGDIAAARRTGVAVDIEEHATDVCALAMIVDPGTADRYALAIAAPARRFADSRDRLEAALRACVRRIEA